MSTDTKLYLFGAALGFILMMYIEYVTYL